MNQTSFWVSCGHQRAYTIVTKCRLRLSRETNLQHRNTRDRLLSRLPFVPLFFRNAAIYTNRIPPAVLPVHQLWLGLGQIDVRYVRLKTPSTTRILVSPVRGEVPPHFTLVCQDVVLQIRCRLKCPHPKFAMNALNPGGALRPQNISFLCFGLVRSCCPFTCISSLPFTQYQSNFGD